MACDTIVGYLIFVVAVHAPIHRHIHPRLGGGSLALSDISMAGLTWKLPQPHMPTVGKEDVIGFSVNPFPGNPLSFLGKLSDLFLFRALCDGFFVAFHADANIRHSGKVLGLEIGMAGVTFQPLFEVLLMIEGNRLSGFEAKAKTDDEEEEKKPGRQSNEKKNSC